MINSSVVGVATGEGTGVAGDFVGVGGRAGDEGDGEGDCASAFVIRKMPNNAGQMNRNIEDIDLIPRFAFAQSRVVS